MYHLEWMYARGYSREHTDVFAEGDPRKDRSIRSFFAIALRRFLSIYHRATRIMTKRNSAAEPTAIMMIPEVSIPQ